MERTIATVGGATHGHFLIVCVELYTAVVVPYSKTSNDYILAKVSEYSY